MSDDDVTKLTPAEIEALADTPEFRALYGEEIGVEITESARPVYLPDMAEDEGLPALTADHFRDVCRAGQGPLTCRFAAMSLDGIICGKAFANARAAIEARAALLRSQGDNCPGRKGHIPADTRF